MGAILALQTWQKRLSARPMAAVSCPSHLQLHSPHLHTLIWVDRPTCNVAALFLNALFTAVMVHASGCM